MKLTTATEYDHQANDCVQCVWHQSEDGWTKAAAVAAAPWRAYIKVNHTIGRSAFHRFFWTKWAYWISSGRIFWAYKLIRDVSVSAFFYSPIYLVTYSKATVNGIRLARKHFISQDLTFALHKKIVRYILSETKNVRVRTTCVMTDWTNRLYAV